MDSITLRLGHEGTEDRVQQTFGAALRQRLYVAMPSALAESATTSAHEDIPSVSITMGVDREALELIADEEVMADIGAARRAHARAAAGLSVDWDTVIDHNIVQ